MLEGVYLSHRIAFEVLGIQRVYSGSAVANRASRQVACVAGYVLEGTRRKSLLAPDGYHNVYLWGLFPEEFAAGRKGMEALLYMHQDPPEITEEDKCRIRTGLARLGDAGKVMDDLRSTVTCQTSENLLQELACLAG